MAVRKIKLSPLSQENGNLTNTDLSERRRSRNLVRDSKGNSTLIEQTADAVLILAGRVDGAESNISVVAGAIELKVSASEIISRINQTAEEVKIQANKISLEGLVTVNHKFQIRLDGSMEASGGTFTGNVHAQTGIIGGFAIGNDTLSAGLTNVNAVGIGSARGDSVAFYAGNLNPTLAPFRVLRNGTGLFGGWTFNSNSISRGNTILSASGSDGSITIGGVLLSSITTHQLRVEGSLDIVGGISATQDVSFTNINPRFGNQYDIGMSILRWKTIYLQNQPDVPSDISLKENIKVVLDDYNDVILGTEVIEYNLIGSEDRQIGINANKFHEKFQDKAELITKVNSGGLYSANYVAFVPMLIKTVQSLEKRLTQLEVHTKHREEGRL